MLDMLALENIHLANALKVILTTAFNTLAVVIFLAVGRFTERRDCCRDGRYCRGIQR